MTIVGNIKKSKPWEWLALVFAIIALAYALGALHGCAMLKGTAWPAGGAAAGAAVGSLAGPGGTLVGAAVGGGAGHLMGEDSELRSGDLQGEGAAKKEIERWKGRAASAETGLGVAEHAARLFHMLVWAAIGYLVWLRREWLWRTIKGPSRVQSLLHALVAGARTRPKD
jgi:hypothetical protein